MQQIKNVVFDIGNVVVRWSPLEIVRLAFGDIDSPQDKVTSIFQTEQWRRINKEQLSSAQVIALLETLGLTKLESEKLFYYIKQTQIELFGSVELIKRVKAAGYNVYALTDNVSEIVAYLQQHHHFWPLFDGTVVSADVGMLKPQPEIYTALLEQNNLLSEESVFIDDMPHNVAGARNVGMSAIQFYSAEQCEQALKSLGLEF